MKIIVSVIPTVLVTNSLLSHFCPFAETKSKNQVFSKLVVWQQETILFFVYSKSRSTSKVCRIQKIFIRGSPYMLFLFILQFHAQNEINVQGELTNKTAIAWSRISFVKGGFLHKTTNDTLYYLIATSRCETHLTNFYN